MRQPFRPSVEKLIISLKTPDCFVCFQTLLIILQLAAKKSAKKQTVVKTDSGMINENNVSSFPHPQVHAEEA